MKEKIWIVFYHAAWLFTGLALALGLADFASVILQDVLNQLFFIDLRLPCVAFVLGCIAFACSCTAYVMAGILERKEESAKSVKVFALSILPFLFNLFYFVTLASY